MSRRSAGSVVPNRSCQPRKRRFFAQAPRLAGLAAGALLALFAAEGRAEQFILMDATFSYTWDDAMNAKPDKSHFYVNDKNFMNKNRPINWLSPVDYRNGIVHVRAEVFEKPPGDQTTGWTLCYIANMGGYGCADTDYYKSTGIFEREVKMTEWWNNDQLQWDKGVKQLDMIYAINDSGSGHITNYPALKDLTTPTRVRVTMVQVSAGSKYDPSILAGIGIGPGDGGVGGAMDAGGGASSGSGGATVDAASGLDAAVGSGGAGGSTTTMTGSGGAMTTAGTGGTSGASAGSGGSSGATPGSSGGSISSSGCAMASPRRVEGWGGFAAGAALSLIVSIGRARRRRRH